MKQTVLITGANGDLGRAIAREFLEDKAGHFVWLGIHSRSEHAKALNAEFADHSELLTFDVTDDAAWKNALKHLVNTSGRLDVLVNNAGIYDDGLLAQLSLDAWERVRAANLDAVFHGCQAVLPQMITQRYGRIINISSISALLPPPGQSNYAAAKAGAIALTQSLAKEVARIGITVNAVCPGYIETETSQNWKDQERKQAMDRIPMRRFGKPREVSAAIKFLACPEAGYITGSVLKIDGGIL